MLGLGGGLQLFEPRQATRDVARLDEVGGDRDVGAPCSMHSATLRTDCPTSSLRSHKRVMNSPMRSPSTSSSSSPS